MYATLFAGCLSAAAIIRAKICDPYLLLFYYEMAEEENSRV
jgi:hypothetical protein